MTPEMMLKIAAIREKVKDGTATLEDMKEGIRLVREDRTGALTASAASKKKAIKAEVPSAADLLNELEGL